MKKRAICFLLAVLMIFTMLPVQIFAQGGENQVRVMVENKTYPVSEGASWEGVLVDKWVDIDQNSTMMSAVKEAIESEGHTQKGAENNYISSINGLGEFSGSYSSGWMGTINDWFTNSGFGDFSVANGTLESGDFIHIQFTNNLGEDIGGSWGNADKSLKAISFASGSLDKEFSPNVYDYTLNISADVEEISVTPTAANKNFMVKATLGETEEKGGVVYKRTANIPVENGDKITVEIGNPSWPSMNSSSEPSKVYTFTIVKEEAQGVREEQIVSLNEWAKTKASKIQIQYESLDTMDDWWKIAEIGKVKGQINENTLEWLKAQTLNEDGSLIVDVNSLTKNILALRAAGMDPENYYGHNLIQELAALNVSDRGIWSFGPALSAFASDDYTTEINGKPYSDFLNEQIDKAIGMQTPTGVWDMWGWTDASGFMLYALAPFYNTNPKVKAAVDKAAEDISTRLLDNADVVADPGNANSITMVVGGLLSNNPDFVKDPRFVKNGKTMLDALKAYDKEDSYLFHWMKGSESGNLEMATEQANRALVSYLQKLEGKGMVFDYRGTEKRVVPEQESEINKTALQEAIEKAEGTKQVAISKDGSDIVPEEKWTTEEAKDAFVKAIEAAKGVLAKEDATQDEVENATKAMNQAIQSYLDAQKEGSKKETVDTTSLFWKYYYADQMKRFEVGISPEEVAQGVHFTTAEEKQAFEDALMKALEQSSDDLTQTELDQAIADLEAAINAYKKAGEKVGTKTEGLFIFDKSSQTITGYQGKQPPKDLVIPEEIDGVKVKHIGLEAFYYTKNPSSNQKNYISSPIETLVLPEGIETIGVRAFASNNLKSVKIPATVKTIDGRAFYGNLDFSNLDFANGSQLEKIGAFAFSTTYKSKEFITEITLPNTVKEIGERAFEGHKISELTLPTSLETLAGHAFGENKIAKVVLPEGIKNLGKNEDGKATSGAFWKNTNENGDYIYTQVVDKSGKATPYNVLGIVNPVEVTIKYVDEQGNEVFPSVKAIGQEWKKPNDQGTLDEGNGNFLTDYVLNTSKYHYFNNEEPMVGLANNYYMMDKEYTFQAPVKEEYISPKAITKTFDSEQGMVEFVYKLEKPATNKEALQEAITAEKALAKADTTSANGKDVEKDKTWVTEDVQKALEKALTNAEEILAKDNATQEEIDGATEALKVAIEGYKPQKGIKEENPTKPEPEKKPTPWIPVKPVEKEENKEISKETLKENAEQKLLENKGRFQNMTDIANHWAKPAIQYAMEKGIFYGTSETTFTPNKEATRAEFVTVLGRMANVDPSKYTKGTMKDVASGVYYENYVNWAVEKGIVKGVGENLFEPDRNITREEMATILHRYLQFAQKEYKDRTNKEYNDQNKISDWAKEAVEKLSKKELLQGRETGEFDPKAHFTRAEVAQVILNLEVK